MEKSSNENVEMSKLVFFSVEQKCIEKTQKKHKKNNISIIS